MNILFLFFNSNGILWFCNLFYYFGNISWISFHVSCIYGGFFVLFFKFPPYATNETGKVTGVNRRELGHGECKSINLHDFFIIFLTVFL